MSWYFYPESGDYKVKHTGLPSLSDPVHSFDNLEEAADMVHYLNGGSTNALELLCEKIDEFHQSMTTWEQAHTTQDLEMRTAGEAMQHTATKTQLIAAAITGLATGGRRQPQVIRDYGDMELHETAVKIATQTIEAIEDMEEPDEQ